MAEAAQPDDPEAARERLERIERELQERSQRQEELARKAEEAGREAEALKRRVTAMTARVQAVEARVATIARKVETLSDMLDEATAALAERRERMADLLAALQRLSRRPSDFALLKPGAAKDSVQSALLLRETVPALRRQAEAIGAKVAEIRELRGELRAEEDALADQRDKLAAERSQLRELRRRRQAERARLEDKAEQQAARVAELAEESQNLEDLLAALERERERRMAAARDAAERLDRKRPRPDAPSEPGEAAPFSEARGELPLPARGDLATAFGEAEDPLRRKGITIATVQEAQVVAPYDGRVAFSGRFGAYGRLLIIAHSEGYHTLLAGMEQVYASVGQWVLAGEPVGVMSEGASESGTAGSSSKNGAPRLYVELRRDGTPVDPLPWLASGLGRVGS